MSPFETSGESITEISTTQTERDEWVKRRDRIRKDNHNIGSIFNCLISLEM
jgi:hypothetical protein